MAIISADDWRKKQGGAGSVGGQGGIISAAEFAKNQVSNPNQANIDKAQAGLKRLQADIAANPPPKEPSSLLKGMAFLQSLVPFQEQIGKAVRSEGVAKVLAPAQAAIEGSKIPEANLGKGFVPEFASGILNLPAHAQQSAIKTGKNLEAIGQGKDIPTTKILADLMPAADFVVTLATLGVGKEAIKGGIKGVASTPIGKNVLKKSVDVLVRNAKTLGPAGAAFGLSQGIQANQNAPDVGTQLQQSIPYAAGGAAIATGAGVAGEAAIGGVKAGLRTFMPAAKEITSQLPNAKDQFATGSIKKTPLPP